VAILRRHPVEQVRISESCGKHGLQPTVFYRWQKELFENGVVAFQQKGRPDRSAGQERIDRLEKKIQTKDEERLGNSDPGLVPHDSAPDGG
jgi:transposase